jgi:hypothetical protein
MTELTRWMREDGESEMETPRKLREALIAKGVDPGQTELLECFDDNDDPWLVFARVRAADGTIYEFDHEAHTGAVLNWRSLPDD